MNEHKRDRYNQIEKRSWKVLYILATMTLGAAIVCSFGPWIPEPLLLAAATTMLCSGVGLACIMLIWLDNILRHLDSM